MDNLDGEMKLKLRDQGFPNQTPPDPCRARATLLPAGTSVVGAGISLQLTAPKRNALFDETSRFLMYGHTEYT